MSKEGTQPVSELLDTFDFSATDLGLRGHWPQSLRTVVSTMMASGHAMCLAWGAQRTFLYNDAYARILGQRHPGAFGRPFAEVWPEVWDEIEPLVERTFLGETVTFEDMPLSLFRNGYSEETSWTFSYSPVRDENDAIAGLLNVTLETTAVRAAREQQRILNLELAHRLKNTLSLVQAIAHQTFGSRPDDAVRALFDTRIAALSKASDLLMQDQGTETHLLDLAMAALSSFGSRISMAGPDVMVGHGSTMTVALLLHELATNATKYGSLSVAKGTVELSWAVEGDGGEARLILDWVEQGGPPATVPTRHGFGSKLLKRGLSAAAGSDLRYRPEGFAATFKAKLADIRKF